jgi:hypothetical protein
MLLGKKAESEAIVRGKPGIRVSLQAYPTGPVGLFYREFWGQSFMLIFPGNHYRMTFQFFPIMEFLEGRTKYG